jgi:FKBP-type peptidyl-prolyl cis-trans isomerase
MTEDGRQLHERDKRELLKIENLKLGRGPLVAWGRKISAVIEVRYTDGTVVYRGPMFIYSGFRGSVFIHNTIMETGLLSSGQTGIWTGINGMAVGGKRRITIEPELVSSSDLPKRDPNDPIWRYY